MKYFAEFLDEDLSGNVVKPCGSDSVFILDGRNSLDTMIQDSLVRLESLKKNIHPDWCGFTIRKGTRFDNAVDVYSYLEESSHSIVRENLMKDKMYRPYCDGCNAMPRTNFNGEQFVCPTCGWLSQFPSWFMAAYKMQHKLPPFE